MAVVAVFVVVLIARMAGCVHPGEGGLMVMAVIVDMNARSGNPAPDVPVYADCRRPGKLERDNKQDDQHKQTSHGVHFTEFVGVWSFRKDS